MQRIPYIIKGFSELYPKADYQMLYGGYDENKDMSKTGKLDGVQADCHPPFENPVSRSLGIAVHSLQHATPLTKIFVDFVTDWISCNMNIKFHACNLVNLHFTQMV